MAVIRPEITTDPAELERIAIDYLQDAIPGWEPHDGDLMTWLIGAHARMVAEERDIAADVPLEQILRPLGEEVYRVAPRVATPATVSAVVTLRDDRGYTIPAGTEVLVRTAGDDGVTMAVESAVTVDPPARPGEPGTDRAAVRLRAIAGREGTSGNGLGSDHDVVPIRPLEFIESISLTDTSDGGTDAETDEQYLQRLVNTLALTSPTPILPEDFAAIARQQPGVGRALAFNNSVPREEVLSIVTSRTSFTITDGTTGDSFTVASGRSNAEVRTLFAIYDPIVEGGVIGSAPLRLRLRNRGGYGPWTVGPTSDSATVTVLQRGGDPILTERAIVIAVVAPNGGRVSDTARESVQQTLEGMRELNWTISVIDPTDNPVTIDFTAIAWPGYDAGLVETAAADALAAYLSPARWGTGEEADGSADGTVWIQEDVVRYLEVAQVLNDVPGLRYVTELRIAVRDGALASNDVELDGLAPLPSVRSITGRVLEG